MSYKLFLNENSIVLVGNGLNLVKNSSYSWENVLNAINPDLTNVPPKGYTLTEYFEILNSHYEKSRDLKDLFIDRIKELNFTEVHQNLVMNCQNSKTNILTTNFDHTIQKSSNFKESSLRPLKKGFTNYYPWQRFYVKKKTENSIKLWHIHGDIYYKNSIKLSVSEYAGNLNYFRGFDPIRNNSRYYNDETWINELMTKRLIVFGLLLGETEFFLRAILINRNRYLKSKKIELDDVFLMKQEEYHANKEKIDYFVKNIGLRIVEYPDFESIYE